MWLDLLLHPMFLDKGPETRAFTSSGNESLLLPWCSAALRLSCSPPLPKRMRVKCQEAGCFGGL